MCRTLLTDAGITSFDLLYNAGFQRKVNDIGRGLNDAIQRAATMQAEKAGTKQRDRAKELNGLVAKGMKETRERAKKLPSFGSPGDFPALAKTILAEKDEARASLMLNSVIAGHIRQGDGWSERIGRLVAILNQDLTDLARAYVDAWLGEHLANPDLLQKLLTTSTNGERLKELANLYRGQWQPERSAEEKHILADLNKVLKMNPMPGSRTGLVKSIHLRLDDPEPLLGRNVGNEIVAHRKLFNRLVLKKGVIGGKRTVALIEKRVSRLISDETLRELSRQQGSLLDRLVYLSKIHKLAIGPGNRATVRKYFDQFISSRDFESRLFENMNSPLQRLHSVGVLHRAFSQADMDEETAQTYLPGLEVLQANLIRKGNLIGEIDKRTENPATKSLFVADLMAEGVFAGRNVEAMRKVIEHYLSDPNYMTAYLADAKNPRQRERKMEILNTKLGAAGAAVPAAPSDG